MKVRTIRVLDAAGSPVPGTTIQLIDDDREVADGPYASPSCITNADGDGWLAIRDSHEERFLVHPARSASICLMPAIVSVAFSGDSRSIVRLQFAACFAVEIHGIDAREGNEIDARALRLDESSKEQELVCQQYIRSQKFEWHAVVPGWYAFEFRVLEVKHGTYYGRIIGRAEAELAIGHNSLRVQVQS